MEWVRNNRFLAGFLGAMVVGVGVLGFLLYSSYSRYSQVNDEYNTQTTELKRLQGLQPYPEQENLVKYNDQNKLFAAAVNDLQGKLAAMEPPVKKSSSPSEFQNDLRAVVGNIVQSARTAGVALQPENAAAATAAANNFYLGFEQYRDALPDAAAVPLLYSQLDALEKLVNILIKNKVDRLSVLKRAPLEQEGAPTPDAATGGLTGKKPAPGATPLITRQVVELDFSGPPSSVRQSLNDITKSDRLYVVRALQVKNQVQTGPLRGGGVDPSKLGGSAAASPGSNPSPATSTASTSNAGEPSLPDPNQPPPLRYVVGQEKVDVASRIELIKIAPPAAVR